MDFTGGTAPEQLPAQLCDCDMKAMRNAWIPLLILSLCLLLLLREQSLLDGFAQGLQISLQNGNYAVPMNSIMITDIIPPNVTSRITILVESFLNRSLRPCDQRNCDWDNNNTNHVPTFSKSQWTKTLCQMAVANGSEPNLKMARMIRKSIVEPAKSRIMCVTYSYHGRHERVRAVKNTWAKRCQGYMASSDLDDESISAVNITHEGKEEYKNMWQKTRATMVYLNKTHADQYDWFFFAGDDEYVILENLQAYLASEELRQAAGLKFSTDTTPLLIGRRVVVRRKMFVSGGGGYVLSRAGLRLFVEKVILTCKVHERSSAEDVHLTHCMGLYGAIIPDTQDAKGLTRFVAFNPDQYFSGQVSNRRVLPLCCSEHVITLHYLQPSEILWFDSFLYGGENDQSCALFSS